MHRSAFLLPLLLTLFPARPAHAGENPLAPSPHKTPEAALKAIEMRGFKRTQEVREPREADVVGAVSKLADGRLGFMPLLQHHMAVEHWFLEGLDVSRLAQALRDGQGRCFVRLRGTLTSLGAFGGSPLDWYGTGLEHGRDWGPVMGYHVRVYRLEAKEIVWVRSLAQHRAARAGLAQLMRGVEERLQGLDYAGAAATLAEALEVHRDTGADVRGLLKQREYVQHMLILLRAPATWTEAEKAIVAQMLVLAPHAPFREVRPGALEKLVALVRSWPHAVRRDQAPLAVKAWFGLPYRHQRLKARAVVAALEVPVTERFEVRVAEAELQIEAARKRLDALRGTGDYTGMLDLLEKIKPHQDVILDYAFGEQRTKHWVPAARRLAALEVAMGDPETRVTVLGEQLRATVASRTGLPNSKIRPRYNQEVIERFVPRLTKAEREQAVGVLAGLVRELLPRAEKHWAEVLLLAELLAGFGGEQAKELMRQVLERTRSFRGWQRTHLQRFGSALGM